jgi:hypothetical protein
MVVSVSRWNIEPKNPELLARTKMTRMTQAKARHTMTIFAMSVFFRIASVSLFSSLSLPSLSFPCGI